MKMPTNCPFCNDIMNTDYEYIWEVMHKKCNKRIGHNIEFIAERHDDDKVDTITIQITHKKTVSWCLRNMTLAVQSKGSSACNIPFFEPNLTNYHALMDKLKTYMIFS